MLKLGRYWPWKTVSSHLNIVLLFAGRLSGFRRRNCELSKRFGARNKMCERQSKALYINTDKACLIEQI